MTNTNKSTAPMTLAELKAWVEETCELSELLQTKDYKSYLPEEKKEEFEAIAFSVFNCLESFSMMLEDDELHYQPKPIEDSDYGRNRIHSESMEFVGLIADKVNTIKHDHGLSEQTALEICKLSATLYNSFRDLELLNRQDRNADKIQDGLENISNAI